jgi:peptidoglycan/xylan/chitin deacetylase (PgdA/CDA1 family)
MPRQVCAVSVDLDAIRFYEQIHGLLPATTARCPVYSTAIERLSAWAGSLSLPLTWFVVGADTGGEGVAGRLRGLVQRGDELGNHTQHHYYDLTHRPSAELRDEIVQTTQCLAAITGQKRFGFRAPGYRVTRELISVLRDTDALYDSSVFPCPAYYAAKAGVLLGQRLTGRRSRAVLDRPSVLVSPRVPHRLASNLRPSAEGLLELPITVTPGLRLPYIGTTLTLSGTRIAKSLTYMLRHQHFVGLELHGIDALDRFDDLEPLANVQPDLRTAWQVKLALFTDVVVALQRHGFKFVTLRDAAAAFES